MKTISIFILAILFSSSGFSQDTLYTKEGKTILGKVAEITQNEIKYKSASNPEGPLYVINKSDVVLIEYKNGTKEVFQNTTNASGNSTSTTSNQTNNSSNSDPVYVNTRPRVNVIIGNPLPVMAWGWGGFGWNRPYYYGGGYRYHGGYYGGHHGHYGRRGCR